MTGRGVEREPAFRDLARLDRVSGTQAIEERRQRALRHELEEELDFGFIWRGCDGIGALDEAAAVVDAEGRVLARREVKIVGRDDPDHPQVVGKIHPARDANVEELVRRSRHQHTS